MSIKVIGEGDFLTVAPCLFVPQTFMTIFTEIMCYRLTSSWLKKKTARATAPPAILSLCGEVVVIDRRMRSG